MSAQHQDVSTPVSSLQEVDSEKELICNNQEQGEKFNVLDICLSPGQEDDFTELADNQAPDVDALGTLVKDSQDYLMSDSQICKVVDAPTSLVPAGTSQDDWSILTGCSFQPTGSMDWNTILEEDGPSLYRKGSEGTTRIRGTQSPYSKA